jgi:hypothetical protein
MVLTHTDFVRNGPVKSSSFSFVPAILEYNIIKQGALEANKKSRVRHEMYDMGKPSTWPLVTLEVLNKHLKGEYTGRQELPPYVAYDPQVMEKYLAKHASKMMQAKRSALHSRYPANFEETGTLKRKLIITTEEETAFRTTMGATPKAGAGSGGAVRTPNQPMPTPAPQTSNKATPCQNTSCNESRNVVQELTARLASLKRKFQAVENENAELKAETERLMGKRARIEDYESDEEKVPGNAPGAQEGSFWLD